jgi:hypothetical protein
VKKNEQSRMTNKAFRINCQTWLWSNRNYRYSTVWLVGYYYLYRPHIRPSEQVPPSGAHTHLGESEWAQLVGLALILAEDTSRKQMDVRTDQSHTHTALHSPSSVLGLGEHTHTSVASVSRRTKHFDGALPW